jgi:hypothetical protein
LGTLSVALAVTAPSSLGKGTIARSVGSDFLYARGISSCRYWIELVQCSGNRTLCSAPNFLCSSGPRAHVTEYSASTSRARLRRDDDKTSILRPRCGSLCPGSPQKANMPVKSRKTLEKP